MAHGFAERIAMPVFFIRLKPHDITRTDLFDFLRTPAGTPPTTVFAGTSFLTTAPAATPECSPMVTPGSIVAPAPIQAFFLITTTAETNVFLPAASTE